MFLPWNSLQKQPSYISDKQHTYKLRIDFSPEIKTKPKYYSTSAYTVPKLKSVHILYSWLMLQTTTEKF